ncbi:hypothetical protein [Anaerosporobacter sp.]
MKKILPITEPVINAYPDYVYPLSVLMNHEETKAWLYCNFIQLYFLPSDSASSLRYYYTDINNRLWNTRNPLMNYQVIHKEILARYKVDIIDFIIDSLDSGNYLYLYLDEYYIPNRISYKREHYIHTTFFYGYDKEEKKLCTYGYDNTRHFIYETLDFDLVKEAYYGCKKAEFEDLDMIYLLRYNEQGSPYEFDIQSLIRQIKEFLNSTRSSDHYDNCFNKRENMYFGMEALRQFREYFIQANDEQIFHCNKNIYLLWEYVLLMNKRIEYLIQQGYLVSDSACIELFTTLEGKYKSLISTYIKYIEVRGEKLQQKILTSYDTNMEILQQAMELLLSEVEMWKKKKN